MPSHEIAASETKSPHTEYLSALTFSTEASFSVSHCVRHRGSQTTHRQCTWSITERSSDSESR